MNLYLNDMKSRGLFVASLWSCRHMGEVIYGSGIRGMFGGVDEEDELVQELEEELAGRRRTAAMVAGVGGAAAWDKLQAKVAKELRRMY